MGVILQYNPPITKFILTTKKSMINFLFIQNLFNASAASCQIFHNHPTAISDIQYLFVKNWLPNTKITEQGHD